MYIWLVIYKTNTGSVYGWLCQAPSASKAEEEFHTVVLLPYTTIKSVVLFEADIVEELFAAYGEDV